MNATQARAVLTAREYDQGNIGPLDDAATRRLVASVVLTESRGGELAITNAQGYVGRYQAGAGWLVDAGLVDRERYDAAFRRSGFRSEWDWAVSGGMTRFLEEPNNWRNGLSLDRYKADGDLQDRAFRTVSEQAYREGVRRGALSPDDSSERVAGFLKARHIAGLGGAENAIRFVDGRGGREISDANGTSNVDYFNDIARNRDGLGGLMREDPARLREIAGAGPGRAPSAPGAPMADGVLREGERGADVRQLQERLNAVGARDAAGRVLGTDGQFGQRTEDAVRNFQRARGLEVDGLAGPETLRALDAAVRARAASPMADGVLREGERGAEVRQLQERLNAAGARDAAGRVLGTDGQFGQRTEDAVRNFQRARGLEVDGIAGPETLRALQRPAPTRPAPGTPGAPEPTPPAGLRSGWPVPGRTEINVADKPGEGGGEFGEARSGGREHKGIDINGRVGDRIEAFAPGRVVFTGQMRGFGNTVIIQHDGGVQTVYAHLDRITVRDQQQVDRSTPIATMGRSGNTPSTGDTHLHFEIREGANGTPLSGRAVDPRRYLHFEGETSQRVGEIQQHLQRLDIRDGRGQPIRADMGYGDRTREAVENFQRSRGIEVTGIVDPSTLDALRRAQPQPRLEPRADVAPMDVRTAALAHPMVRQADAALQREQPGLPADQRLAIAASLADQGTRRGLTEITSVAAGPNGSWFAIQGDVRREDFQQASVSREQIAQPLEKPLASLAEQDRQRAATAAAELPNLPRERSPHLT